MKTNQRCGGIKEFAKKIKMASPNILRVIDRRHNSTQDTLNRLLKPFDLRLAVAEIGVLKKTRAS